MRIIVAIAGVLLAGLGPARATVGFDCTINDKLLKAGLSGAYGMSLGSGLANFGAELDLRQAGLPPDIRKLKLDSSHVRQNWFVGRTLNIMMAWSQEKPYREVVLIVETHRGKTEDSPYRGRYTLNINVGADEPASAAKRFEAGGAASCAIGA